MEEIDVPLKVDGLRGSAGVRRGGGGLTVGRQQRAPMNVSDEKKSGLGHTTLSRVTPWPVPSSCLARLASERAPSSPVSSTTSHTPLDSLSPVCIPPPRPAPPHTPRHNQAAPSQRDRRQGVPLCLHRRLLSPPRRQRLHRACPVLAKLLWHLQAGRPCRPRLWQAVRARYRFPGTSPSNAPPPALTASRASGRSSRQI